MEVLLPIGAMLGLYVMANQDTSRKRQGFRGRRSRLPNTNLSLIHISEPTRPY